MASEADAAEQTGGSNSTPAGEEASTTKWLEAHRDPLALLYTFSSCMCLADLHGDGDYKLVVADLGTGSHGMKLKVYKGTYLSSEQTIVDLPTGVVAFHMDSCEPRIPAIAVASGGHVYVYKNMRPFYKFTLPTLEVNAAEMDAWNQAKQDKLDVSALKEVLENIRAEAGEANLTARSQRFLMLDLEDMTDFARMHRDMPLKKQTVVTCLGTMKKSLAEEDAASVLVLGTENRSVYVLEPDAFTILASMAVPSIPVFLDVSGLFDVEYRIIVACRNGGIYVLKRGYKSGKLCFEVASQPVGLLRASNTIVVGCMDDTLSCFSSKGKCLWTNKMPSSIVAMEAVDVAHLGLRLVAVSLEGGRVHLFQEKALVDVLTYEETIVALKFGRFGREENTLVMVTRGGGLVVKILKRTAQFQPRDTPSPSDPSQGAKLSIPKKTKLFVDQTMREREHFVAMHRTFQHDLYKLRLQTARAYVRALALSLRPVSQGSKDPLKLSAQVQGLGPAFRLRLELQNTSLDRPSLHLFLSFFCDTRIYAIDTPYIPVPFLAPGLVYAFSTRVECVSSINVSDVIKVFVSRPGEGSPILTAFISMPPSEGASFNP